MIEAWKREHDLWMAYSADAEAARLEAIEATLRHERLSSLANEHRQLMQTLLDTDVEALQPLTPVRELSD